LWWSKWRIVSLSATLCINASMSLILVSMSEVNCRICRIFDVWQRYAIHFFASSLCYPRFQSRGIAALCVLHYNISFPIFHTLTPSLKEAEIHNHASGFHLVRALSIIRSSSNRGNPYGIITRRWAYFDFNCECVFVTLYQYLQ
jgi:hypothetical protein